MRCHGGMERYPWRSCLLATGLCHIIRSLIILSLIFSLSLFIKNSNLVYTNKSFVSNLICCCEFTKYLFYNNHFGVTEIALFFIYRRCLYLTGNTRLNGLLRKFFFSLFKNSNLVYTNKPFVSNLICYCEFTKYLFYNNHFGSDNISALP
jgi:hypothetical protein